MPDTSDYIAKNKHSWNQRTAYHVSSAFYGMDKFLQGQTSLNDIEIGLLGNIKGLKILHLQCHFGQDSLSLARMGATVTGVDFSENAISQANQISKELKTEANFICCDIYDLPIHLNEQFDIVYTSYGTIGWLPDLNKWSDVVARFLLPGGYFVFVEFHPVVWMFDNNFNKIAYSYFNDGPIIEADNGTYADKSAPINSETISWNHSLDEVLGNLLSKDLQLVSFKEFNYSPYNCFNGMEEYETGKFRIKQLGNNIPMVYALKAVKC